MLESESSISDSISLVFRPKISKSGYYKGVGKYVFMTVLAIFHQNHSRLHQK